MAAVVAKYAQEWNLVEEWLKEPYPTSKEEIHRISNTRWLSNEQGGIALQIGLRKVEKPIHDCYVKVLWMGIVNGFGPMADEYKDGCRKGHGTKMIQKLNGLVCKHTTGGLYIQDCVSDSANNWAKKMSNSEHWFWIEEEHGLYSRYSSRYYSEEANSEEKERGLFNELRVSTLRTARYEKEDEEEDRKRKQAFDNIDNNNNQGDTKKAKANTVEQVVESESDTEYKTIQAVWQQDFKNKFYCDEKFHLADVVRFLNEAKKAGYYIDLSDKVHIEDERSIFNYVLGMATYCGRTEDPDTGFDEYYISEVEIKNDLQDLKTFFNYGKGLWKRYWDCENNEWNSPLHLIESFTNKRRDCAIDMLPFLKENGHEIDKNERVTLSSEVRDAWDKLNGENPV